jgi:hypothetical protein
MSTTCPAHLIVVILIIPGEEYRLRDLSARRCFRTPTVFITEVKQAKRVPKQRRKGEIKVEKYKTMKE